MGLQVNPVHQRRRPHPRAGNDFDIDLTPRALIASTNAVFAVPRRVVYIALLDASGCDCAVAVLWLCCDCGCAVAVLWLWLWLWL